MVVVTHQAEKIWTFDRTTVQGATFNMRGQLYRGHAKATALSRSPLVSALGSESDDPGSIPGRGKALCTWGVRGATENSMQIRSSMPPTARENESKETATGFQPAFDWLKGWRKFS